MIVHNFITFTSFESWTIYVIFILILIGFSLCKLERLRIKFCVRHFGQFLSDVNIDVNENLQFLAHLSRRLFGELISNVFSSWTTGPIEVKFHVEPPWDEGTKVCIWGLGHMTKMAAMPIYGKNASKIFFSGTARPICMKLCM